jgi:hypothetical protein
MVEIRHSNIELMKIPQEDEKDFILAQAILNNIHEEEKSLKSPEEKGNEVNQIISIIENEDYNKSYIDNNPLEEHHNEAPQL